MASKAGIDILKKGGNAADAAIAMSAVVGVVRPMACGIGGDSHCLFYRASDQSVHALNSSGRSSAGLTLQKVKSSGFVTEPLEDANSGLWVNVPGSVAGMFDCVRLFGSGKLSMSELLEPAIKVAEEGYVIGKDVAPSWANRSAPLQSTRYGKDLLMRDGAPPKAGDVVYSKKLAQCLKSIAKNGVEAFYKGPIAQRIVDEVQHAGGYLSMDDMRDHMERSLHSSPEAPLYTDIHGYRLWEMGINTIGVVVLYILKILDGFNLKALGHNSAEYIHIVTEATKIAYSDCWEHICDPDVSPFPSEELFSADHIAQKRTSIHPDRVLKVPEKEGFIVGGSTSYLAVVDEEGNSCSFIFSVSATFGTGLVPRDCGFVLHDRGRCFSLDEKSPNVFGPLKRSLHTIIPAVLTDLKSKELIATFGVVGRWMQPQGHVQVLLNMLIFGMDPQQALSQPRFFVGSFMAYMEYREHLDELCLEDGISLTVANALKEKGHKINLPDKSAGGFGLGHVIAKPVVWEKDAKHEGGNVWFAAADPRIDGMPLGY